MKNLRFINISPVILFYFICITVGCTAPLTSKNISETSSATPTIAHKSRPSSTPTPKDDFIVPKQQGFKSSDQQPFNPQPNQYTEKIKTSIENFLCISNYKTASLKLNVMNTGDKPLKSVKLRFYIRWYKSDVKRNDKSLWYELVIPENTSKANIQIEPNSKITESFRIEYFCGNAMQDELIKENSLIEVVGVEFSNTSYVSGSDSSSNLSSSQITLSFDGLYATNYSGGNQYLRFYEDGTMLDFNLPYESKNIKLRWLNERSEEDKKRRSKYTILNNGRIKFVLKSAQGTIEYNCGLIKGDTKESLKCIWHSNINNRDDGEDFYFVSKDEMNN